MNNPQHVGLLECTFMIRSHFTPLLFPHATRTPPLPSEVCAVQDGCSDLPLRQGSPSSANSQDPLFVPSVASAVTAGLRSSGAGGWETSPRRVIHHARKRSEFYQVPSEFTYTPKQNNPALCILVFFNVCAAHKRA